MDAANYLEDLVDHYSQISEHDARSAQYSRRIWEIKKETMGQTHPSTTNALEVLSFAMIGVGDYEEADSIESNILEWRGRVMDENNRVLIQTQQNLAFIRLFIKGKRLDAIKIQQDILLR